MLNNIDLQIKSETFKKVFSKYYHSLPDERKVLFKHTEDAGCLPFMTDMEQVCDFNYWIDRETPIEIFNKAGQKSRRTGDDIFTEGLRIIVLKLLYFKDSKKTS